MASLPLLSLLILTPLLGAILVLARPGLPWARTAALAAGLLELGWSLAALYCFDPADAGFQLVERTHWIASLNIGYFLGVDGLSVLFLPATALLFLGVTLAGWLGIRAMPRLYFALLLLLQAAIMGVFCALDGVLFFVFWELTLAPLYFLTSLWGRGAERVLAAGKYTLTMLTGGAAVLLAFVILSNAGGEPAFDLPTLAERELARGPGMAVFLLFLFGFGVKTPVLPLHTWLPLLCREGPLAVAALTTGLKLGAYGLLRFALPLAPLAARELHWLLAGLGTAAILYGGVIAVVQTHWRGVLAYSSIAHVGLVVLGLASFNQLGVQGAVLQLLNFTLVAGGMCLVLEFLEARTGSSHLLRLGGVAQTMPKLAAVFLLLGLAGLGIPGTAGFPAELMLILSALQTHTGAALAALFGMVLAAAYFLLAYRRAFFGPAQSGAVAQADDLLRREWWIAAVAAAWVLGVGLFPGPVLDLIRPAARVWAARFG